MQASSISLTLKLRCTLFTFGFLLVLLLIVLREIAETRKSFFEYV